MARIDIVDFVPEHLRKIRLRECHLSEDISTVNTRAVTFLIGQEPVAIFGWYYVTDGVMHVWSLLSEGICKKPIMFHKAVRNLIEYAFSELHIRRMQMTVKQGYTPGWKWAKSLGFKCEATMQNYDPSGLACHLFAKVEQ